MQEENKLFTASYSQQGSQRVKQISYSILEPSPILLQKSESAKLNINQWK